MPSKIKYTPESKKAAVKAETMRGALYNQMAGVAAPLGVADLMTFLAEEGEWALAETDNANEEQLNLLVHIPCNAVHGHWVQLTEEIKLHFKILNGGVNSCKKCTARIPHETEQFFLSLHKLTNLTNRKVFPL